MKEKAYEEKIKEYLNYKDCWYVKFFANAFTKSGIPDILACVNGYFVAIEVKAENGHPSELQIWNRNQIRKAGGVSIILYPSQFEEFKALITHLKSGNSYVDWKYQRTFDEDNKTK